MGRFGYVGRCRCVVFVKVCVYLTHKFFACINLCAYNHIFVLVPPILTNHIPHTYHTHTHTPYTPPHTESSAAQYLSKQPQLSFKQRDKPVQHKHTWLSGECFTIALTTRYGIDVQAGKVCVLLKGCAVCIPCIFCYFTTILVV